MHVFDFMNAREGETASATHDMTLLCTQIKGMLTFLMKQLCGQIDIRIAKAALLSAPNQLPDTTQNGSEIGVTATDTNEEKTKQRHTAFLAVRTDIGRQ